MRDLTIHSLKSTFYSAFQNRDILSAIITTTRLWYVILLLVRAEIVNIEEYQIVAIKEEDTATIDCIPLGQL